MKQALTFLKSIIPTIMMALTIINLYNPKIAVKIQNIIDLLQELIIDIEAFIGKELPKPFSGLEGTNLYGNEVIKRLREIKSEDVITGRLMGEAEALSITLSNELVIHQAKSGKDKDALSKFKTDAYRLVNEIRAKMA
jgi:hypothetical protein